MSHISKIEMKIKNLAALKRACEKMGLEFREDQQSFSWYGQNRERCDHAIHVPGASYEIRIVKSKTKANEFEMLWDSYSRGGLTNKLGQDGGLLKQAYAVEQTMQTAMNQGHMVTTQKQKDGVIRLVVTVH